MTLLFSIIITAFKLLKALSSIRSLLQTIGNALPQVGNLGLLFLLLFFIFAALGLELFGRLGIFDCNVIKSGLDKARLNFVGPKTKSNAIPLDVVIWCINQLKTTLWTTLGSSNVVHASIRFDETH